MKRRLVLPPIAIAVAVAVIATVTVLAWPAGQSCGCALPPNLAGVADTPMRWRDAVSAGQADTAWAMLAPVARTRYRDVSGLAGALPDLGARMRVGGRWRTVAMVTGGAGTETDLVEVLVDDGHRLLTAIVVHTRADGSRDGTVDPDTLTGLQIVDPADGSQVPGRPRLRTTGAPDNGAGLWYAAIAADYSIESGATGDIRDPDGYDSPFRAGTLSTGPTLLVAACRNGDRWQVGAVTVRVIALPTRSPVG